MMPRAHDAAAVLLLAAAFAAGPSAAESFDPYAIPKEQFQARVHTIVLKPLDLRAKTPNADAVRQQFEALLTGGLRAKGYTVVPSREYERIWREMSARLGGTFDPVTGEPVKEKYEAAREHTARELARLHGADAILDPYIRISDAGWGGFFVFSTWHEALRWQGGQIVAAPATMPQRVLGAFLNVVISDLAGIELYGMRAGIEWTAVYAARGHEDKPIEQIYDEPDRNQHAVDIALERLIPAAKRS